MKPYVVRWEMRVLRRETAPFSTQLPNTRAPEWVTDKAVNMLISQILGWVQPPELPHCTRRIIVFHVLRGGHVWGALQSSETPHQLSEVWTLGRRGRRDEGADGGGRSCGGSSETTEASMGRISFCPGPHTTVQPFRQPEVLFLCSSLVPPEGGRQCHCLFFPTFLLLNL